MVLDYAFCKQAKTGTEERICCHNSVTESFAKISYISCLINRGNKMTSSKKDYTSKAKELSGEQRERVLSRMTGKLPKRLEKDKLTEEEAIAIQLELEGEQLIEWKQKVATLREKENKKNKKS